MNLRICLWYSKLNDGTFNHKLHLLSALVLSLALIFTSYLILMATVLSLPANIVSIFKDYFKD